MLYKFFLKDFEFYFEHLIDYDLNFVGYGFFNANSKIMVRMLSLNENEVIDKEFFKKRIECAIMMRVSENSEE